MPDIDLKEMMIQVLSKQDRALAASKGPWEYMPGGLRVEGPNGKTIADNITIGTNGKFIESARDDVLDLCACVCVLIRSIVEIVRDELKPDDG